MTIDELNAKYGKPVTSQNSNPFGFTIKNQQDSGFQNKMGEINPSGYSVTSQKSDSLKNQLNNAGNMATNALPAVGATVGGIAGGALGIAGGPPGVLAGSVAGSATGGALGETAKQAIEKNNGQRTSISGKDVATQGAEFGAMELVGGPIFKVAGKVISGLGEGLAKAVIPTSTQEAGLIQTYREGKPFIERLGNIIGIGESTAPKTASSTAFDKNLMGTESMIGVQAKRVGNKLWNGLIKPQLENSKVKVDMPSFFATAEKKIIQDNPEKSRQSSLLEALQAFKEDYKGVSEISLPELQKFKEGWAQFIPEKAYQGKPISGAANDVKDTLADTARDSIYKNLGPEVKQAYLDYGNLKELQELGKKAMTGSKLKGGFGSFWGAIKDMALTPVGTVGGQTVYKVGQGIQLIGSPGARVVRNLFVPSSSTNQ